MSEEKPKEGVKTENDHINLKVAGQDGSVVQFKIKRHTPLSKLMKAYCERQGLSIRQIRFRFDGQPINETDTPAQVGKAQHHTLCWRWKMRTLLMYFSNKQEESTKWHLDYWCNIRFCSCCIVYFYKLSFLFLFVFFLFCAWLNARLVFFCQTFGGWGAGQS
uniref:Ubiquitin-like domain-containing protein n=1 Tax=Poecilia reticulata TaxID=8081 RepID=A0A3P9NV62_POERE